MKREKCDSIDIGFNWKRTILLDDNEQHSYLKGGFYYAKN